MDVTLICRSPGMRRNGVAHPATRTYSRDDWSDDQWQAFEADPQFEIVVSDPADIDDPGSDVSDESTGDIAKAEAAGSEAEQAGQPGDGPPDEGDRPAAIKAAIAALAPKDLTKVGRPKVDALEAALGFKPTKEEIDSAMPAAE